MLNVRELFWSNSCLHECFRVQYSEIVGLHGRHLVQGSLFSFLLPKVLSSLYLCPTCLQVQKDRLDIPSLGCTSTSSYPLTEENSSLGREQALLGLVLYQFFWKRVYLDVHIWELKWVWVKLYSPTATVGFWLFGGGVRCVKELVFSKSALHSLCLNA